MRKSIIKPGDDIFMKWVLYHPPTKEYVKDVDGHLLILTAYTRAKFIKDTILTGVKNTKIRNYIQRTGANEIEIKRARVEIRRS